MKKFLLAVRTTLLVGVAVFALSPANAAVLDIGPVQLGVNDVGSLDDTSAGVGLNLVGVGDALIPGCPCESWGVMASGVFGYTGPSIGTSNISLTGPAFSFTLNTALSTTQLDTLPAGSGLTITHSFGPSASANLFQVLVTLTNTGVDPLTNVQYARAMDWDVPPTPFSEYVTIGGLPATNLLFSGDDGFAVPFVSAGTLVCPANTNFVDCGPSDHGAYFIFGFGDLAAGASQSFKIFYGANYSEALAMADLGAVAAEIYSLGQQNGDPRGGGPGTFVFGFSGVGGTPVDPVPEPATLLLMGGGLTALGLWRRFKKA